MIPANGWNMGTRYRNSWKYSLWKDEDRFEENIAHKVLTTFMAEVAAIMNSRPLVQVDADSKNL